MKRKTMVLQPCSYGPISHGLKPGSALTSVYQQALMKYINARTFSGIRNIIVKLPFSIHSKKNNPLKSLLPSHNNKHNHKGSSFSFVLLTQNDKKCHFPYGYYDYHYPLTTYDFTFGFFKETFYNKGVYDDAFSIILSLEYKNKPPHGFKLTDLLNSASYP